jgi:Fe-S-cluster containining protein
VSSVDALRHHRLTHVAELHVDSSLLGQRFAAGCRTSNCKAACCKGGVWVDIDERARILAHADRVQKMMDASQDHDPGHWFESTEITDPDFASRTAVGTQVVNDRCVFLDSAGRCTLHRADANESEDGPRLKPFFCRIFPITLENGVVMFDDLAADQTACCGVTPEGNSSIFDVCRDELQELLGPDGVEELRHLATIRLERRCE